MDEGVLTRVTESVRETEERRLLLSSFLKRMLNFIQTKKIYCKQLMIKEF